MWLPGGRLAIAVVLMIVMLFMLTVIVRAAYIAFFKKKDERSKWIVTKSMSDAFAVILFMQLVQFALKLVGLSFYQRFWGLLTGAIYFEPIALSLFILGVFLLVNSKRHGGS